jgi:hypothetical protein
MGKFKKKAARELQRKKAENKLQDEPEQVAQMLCFVIHRSTSDSAAE